MAIGSPSRRCMDHSVLFLGRFVSWHSFIILCLSMMMGVSEAQELSLQSCQTQNVRFAISLSGFAWVIWPLLVWYKWLPKQVDYPIRGKWKWLKYKLTNVLRILRDLLWALVLGADCWWISTGGVHQHIKEVLIAQIISQVIGNKRLYAWGFSSVTECWRNALSKHGHMWPASPEYDQSELCQKYWRLCSDSPTALYNFSELTSEVIYKDYSQLLDENYVDNYIPRQSEPDVEQFGFSATRRRRFASNSSTAVSQERSEKLSEGLSNVLTKYVRQESKAYKKLKDHYEKCHELSTDPTAAFKDVIVAQIVSQICGWDTYRMAWEKAFSKCGVTGWPGLTQDEDIEYWVIAQNLSQCLCDANIVDSDFIMTHCEALVDPDCIGKYFPGILDVEDGNPNLDETTQKLHVAMKKVEEHLNGKVIVEDPKLMEISVVLGHSAPGAIKGAPGFKTLHFELIKEFVQVNWSKLGILLTVIYLTAGAWLYCDNNQEAALQWFRSALGSGMLVLLQGTAKTSSKRKRCTRMLVLILVSIGLHSLIGVFDEHKHWFIRWRGLIWSSLWISWLLPMLEFKLCGRYRYGTTFVAFLTFFGRLIDGIGGVLFVLFYEIHS